MGWILEGVRASVCLHVGVVDGGGWWWWCSSRDLVKMQRERRSKKRERESQDRQRGSGRMDGGENERMNKTGEKKLETHITVG